MYIVIELQTNGQGTVSTLTYQYSNKNDAESKFHTILASASVGSLPVHTAVIMTNEGVTLRAECYKNGENAPVEM
jgi:hypothetical protein